jgi:hypothetical protein
VGRFGTAIEQPTVLLGRFGTTARTRKNVRTLGRNRADLANLPLAAVLVRAIRDSRVERTPLKISTVAPPTPIRNSVTEPASR